MNRRRVLDEGEKKLRRLAKMAVGAALIVGGLAGFTPGAVAAEPVRGAARATEAQPLAPPLCGVNRYVMSYNPPIVGWAAYNCADIGYTVEMYRVGGGPERRCVRAHSWLNYPAAMYSGGRFVNPCTP
ncbi:hypothetical protein N8J89_26315 [Crossiella sp. CA-258035]|uniref:hypothetical protein n=1 Tax=Crossiella sp. CA-258035 TaxID=2981138 RepID=UPI0024BC1AD3|nr:hypothetical protein [Crossiella sp. CA-258035]WHT16640.1 hypothetical protein N8J89_26315 [Crossiella sp. CA-258035]